MLAHARLLVGSTLLLILVGCMAPLPSTSPPLTASPAAIASPLPPPSPPPRPSPSPSPRPVPIGSTLAFERDGQIWSAAPDGSEARALTTGGDAATPRWSPDGQQLLYLRGRGMAAELYLVGTGDSQRRLTSNARPESGARWSPRDGRIAYSLPRSLGAGALDPSVAEEVWTIDPRTGDERRVTDGFDPVWSPDGSRLAYATNGRRGAGERSGASQNAIHIVAESGRDDRVALAVARVPRDLEPAFQLPFRPETYRLRAPTWSPDGRSLVASADGHTAMAVTFDENGGNLRVWAPAYQGAIHRAAWSPRGDRLAIGARLVTGLEVVTLVDLPTGHETRIGGAEQGFQAIGTSWAPDGRRLALVSRALPDPRQLEPPRELRIYGADGVHLGVAARGAIGSVDWNPARP